MKSKLFMLLLIFVLGLTSVSASEKYSIDFDQKNVYEIGMHDGDAVEFYFKGNRHIVQIGDIDLENAKVNLISFLWAEEHRLPYYNSIGNGSVLKLDFEVDDVPDVYVSLNKINPDSVSIVFFKVSDAETVSASDFVDFVKHNRVYDKIVLAFFAIILIVVLILIFREK